ncbi:MAG TPA: glycosyltransferase, partial [Armatimonadetes bacterium]|nr:glycosyltransferase [Armatimonadota bacterium]
MNPLISTIILAHNKAAYTRRCLENLLLTQEATLEVWLVDNGSTDETREVFAAFAARAEERGWSV